MRILFVHGTGVRRKQFDELSALVGSSLAAHFPGAEVEAYFWGAEFGATVTGGLKSVPGRGRSSRAPAGRTEPVDEDVAAWSLLLADPLCELRVLARLPEDPEGAGPPPGIDPAGQAVADDLTALSDSEAQAEEGGELATALQATGLAQALPEAARFVAGSAEFTEACASADSGPTVAELTYRTARAVTARLLAEADDQAVVTAEERERLVESVAGALGGIGRWPGERVAAVLGTLALRVAVQPALNHWRQPMTYGSAPALGDILRYQARGEALRDHLLGIISARATPTVVLAHSLGGIAAVDLLAMAAARRTPLEHVALLVTVGSQAPFLHECGALAALDPGSPLPPGFPRWLNVYDRQDLLAFRAEPVFVGDVRVTDREVSSRQPFPLSHSAYWKNDAVYQAMAEALDPGTTG